jgi:hypothetical protein
MLGIYQQRVGSNRNTRGHTVSWMKEGRAMLAVPLRGDAS